LTRNTLAWLIPVLMFSGLFYILRNVKVELPRTSDFLTMGNVKIVFALSCLLFTVYFIRRCPSRSRRLATQLARTQPTQSGGGYRLSAFGSLFRGCSLCHSQAYGHGMEARMGLPRRRIYFMAASMSILDTYNRAG
jgi:hypothetical protein